MKDKPSSGARPLPLVVIGGFLGSGKTTALNHLLANPEGRKIAVIVNDIGELNIDHELIESADANRIALTNGCICCSLKSDLFNAVVEIAGANEGIDAIAIEASGISQPAALIASLKLLETAGVSHTDTVVYLLDANAFAQLDFDQAEAVLDHAALSDLLLINKCDIASDEALQVLEAQLDLEATNTERLRTEFARFPVALAFAPSTSDLERSRYENSAAGFQVHHHGYRQQTLRSRYPLGREGFDRFAAELSQYAWRAKGFVCFKHRPDQVYLFNLVGKRATLETFDSDDKTTRLVIIGRADLMPETIALPESVRPENPAVSG